MHAEDGEEAMQLAEEGEVDLALLDVMMPRRSIAEAVDLVSQKTVAELTSDLSSCGCFVKTKKPLSHEHEGLPDVTQEAFVNQ